jgi:hopanoid C-3 methylase
MAAIDRRLPYDGIAGLTFKNGAEWRENEPRKVSRIEGYNFPDRDLTAGYREHYQRVGMGKIMSALTSRGCSRRCSFCAIWRFHDGKYRVREPARIVDELVGHDVATIDFCDDDSFGNIKNIQALCALATERLVGKTFRFFVRSDAVVKHPAVFEQWARAGFKYALMGIESLNDDELRDINKSSSAAQNREAVKILTGLGVKINGSFIVRQDYTEADFSRLSDDVRSLKISLPAFSTLTPFPGTVLFENVKESLLTTNWDYYDGFHSVMKTALPPEKFYANLADLYRAAYDGFSVGAGPTPWWEEMAVAIEKMAGDIIV